MLVIYTSKSFIGSPIKFLDKKLFTCWLTNLCIYNPPPMSISTSNRKKNKFIWINCTQAVKSTITYQSVYLNPLNILSHQSRNNLRWVSLVRVIYFCTHKSLSTEITIINRKYVRNRFNWSKIRKNSNQVFLVPAKIKSSIKSGRNHGIYQQIWDINYQGAWKVYTAIQK